MKVVIVVVLVSIFSFGFWWFGKHSLQDIQVKEASLISKVEYLKHSIHKKEVEVARLQIVINDYEVIIADWQKLKDKKIINVHDFLDIVGRCEEFKANVHKLEDELLQQTIELKHYKRFVE